ncbi:unnamed protein product [Blepharisma stoltei]|uniref:SKP1 component POZ domain-containing protein n=1 Tax=Blepharisma stoltei TaxID=1481888 RepID=A0AAU9JRC2_9CILI|nr:unnamed protein product [Blepharisma stoltei]
MEGQTIQLVSYEGTVFTVPISILDVSEPLKESPDYESQIHLEPLEIDDEPLRLILTYLEHHEFKPLNLASCHLNSGDLVSHLYDTWDAEFVEGIEIESLLKLLLASQRLDIKTLTEIICMKIAITLRLKDKETLSEEYKENLVPISEHEAWLQEEYFWARGINFNIIQN